MQQNYPELKAILGTRLKKDDILIDAENFTVSLSLKLKEKKHTYWQLFWLCLWCLLLLDAAINRKCLTHQPTFAAKGDSDGNIAIPDYHNALPVVSIKNDVFKGNGVRVNFIR